LNIQLNDYPDSIMETENYLDMQTETDSII